MNQRYFRWAYDLAAAGLLAAALICFSFLCVFSYLEASLPSIDIIVQGGRLTVPLRIYTRDGRLIGQYGDERRLLVEYDQIPERVRDAFLAAEDDRFFRHHGIDIPGLGRALLVNILSGRPDQGAGTITMQTARVMLLTSEKKLRRKFLEIFLAYRIESELTKQQILRLYLNKIFLGQRAYGVAAAAEVYFGKKLDDLNLAEIATIAGLPQAPSDDNPVANPEKAKMRRGYVLRRLRELHKITPEEEQAARAFPMQSQLHGPASEVEAPYLGEMVRNEMVQKYGERVYSEGFRVITTLDSSLQSAANLALRVGLIEYDRRHGYRGASGHEAQLPTSPEGADQILDGYPTVGGLLPAFVTSVHEQSAVVTIKGGRSATIPWSGLFWARAAGRDGGVGPEIKKAADVLHTGDVVYVLVTGNLVELAQVPDAQSALVAIDPRDGAVAALTGGFDFFNSKFNRAVQARRQPGSAFKPFIYSAALENGFTPASVILDAPVVMEDTSMENTWRPRNVTGKFYGPTRLREALVRSRNLVSVRLMRAMGTRFTVDYVSRFGFNKDALPENLTLALGSLQVSPLQLASGYSVFANGGYLIKPYYIQSVEDGEGHVLTAASPAVVCGECADTRPDFTLAYGDQSPGGRLATVPANKQAPLVIRPENAWLLTDMMGDVVRRGTARRALVLARNDIAGKTGTTNDHHDAWFSGFASNLVATVWVGFDDERSLGAGEEGGRTAVPTWTYFMLQAMRGVPEQRRPMPNGLVTVRISPTTGELAASDDPNSIFEIVIEGHLPPPPEAGQDNSSQRTQDKDSKDDEPLF
ncbi:MAG: penicillin-binding protein 1A [Steroidobacteraceae bacterium]